MYSVRINRGTKILKLVSKYFGQNIEDSVTNINCLNKIVSKYFGQNIKDSVTNINWLNNIIRKKLEKILKIL